MQQQKIWKIYKHTNKLNGFSYIGQTCIKNINQRWRNGNGYSKNHCKVFFEAIQKYGWDNFEHEILEDNILTQDEANEREAYWISYYNTCILSPNNKGYNMTYGGNSFGNFGFRWCNNGKEELMISKDSQLPEGFKFGKLPMSEEQKEKLRHKKVSIECRKKIKEANTGRIAITNGIIDKKVKLNEVDYYLKQGFRFGKSKGILFGHKHSEETKKKMSKSGKGKHFHDEEARKKISITTKTAMDKLLSDDKRYSEWHKNMLAAIEKTRGKYHWYTNGVESGKFTECPAGWWPGNLRLSNEIKAKISSKLKGRPSSRRKKVKCLNNDIIYNSLTEAAKELNVSANLIITSIKENRQVYNKKQKIFYQFILWEN